MGSKSFSQDINTSGSIAIGGKALGKIETLSDRDWFKVDLIKGNKYQFESYSDTEIEESLLKAWVIRKSGALDDSIDDHLQYKDVDYEILYKWLEDRGK